MTVETFRQLLADAETALAPTSQPTYEAVLERWQAVQAAASKFTTMERELRLALFGGAVPTPVEGVNNVTLADGRICKFTHKINRTVSDPIAAREALTKVGVNDVDELIKPKYELAVGPYKKLATDSAVRKVLDQYVESKPGLPELKVV